MSISGISASNSLSQSVQSWQTRAQKIQTEFQQIGQDLQSGNLTQARSDFNALSQNLPSSLTQGNSALSQAFSSLGTALQSGDAAAAQKAYSTLQTDLQQVGQGQHHHHHHGGGGSQNSNSSTGSTLSQLFSTLGSALTAGNLSAAQTAYSTLTQAFKSSGWNSGATSQSPVGALSLLG